MLDAYIKAVDSMRIEISVETKKYIDDIIDKQQGAYNKKEKILKLIDYCKLVLSNNKIEMNKNMVQGRASDFMEVSKEEQERIDKEMQVLFLRDKKYKERYHYLKKLLSEI